MLNLWQKNGIYGPEIIQPLLNMATQNSSEGESDQYCMKGNVLPMVIKRGVSIGDVRI